MTQHTKNKKQDTRHKRDGGVTKKTGLGVRHHVTAIEILGEHGRKPRTSGCHSNESVKDMPDTLFF
jgi:hypothetical protein